jgi:hypothetical protein
VRRLAITTLFVAAAAVPAGAATPLASLQYLVGTWHCTYHAGAVSMPYTATWSYDNGGNALRQVTSFGNAGDEELIGYDAQHHIWSVVVLDDHGGATVMQASGDDPNHIAYHSVYPDASIAPTFDKVSDTKYTTHATFSTGGKTIVSDDTCVKTSS